MEGETSTRCDPLFLTKGILNSVEKSNSFLGLRVAGPGGAGRSSSDELSFSLKDNEEIESGAPSRMGSSSSELVPGVSSDASSSGMRYHWYLQYFVRM